MSQNPARRRSIRTIVAIAATLNVVEPAMVFGFSGWMDGGSVSTGTVGYLDGFFDAADETGLLVAYTLPNIRDFGYNLDKPENRGYADNGDAVLKQAAARYLERVCGVHGINPETEVLHSIGSKAALSILPATLINPGDYALMTTPGKSSAYDTDPRTESVSGSTASCVGLSVIATRSPPISPPAHGRIMTCG